MHRRKWSSRSLSTLKRVWRSRLPSPPRFLALGCGGPISIGLGMRECSKKPCCLQIQAGLLTPSDVARIALSLSRETHLFVMTWTITERSYLLSIQ